MIPVNRNRYKNMSINVKCNMYISVGYRNYKIIYK